MSDHTEIRIEHPSTSVTGSRVVAYFAPNFEVNPIGNNDLKPAGGRPMPRDRPARVRDFREIMHEITVQGVFEDTHDPDTGTPNLPSEHTEALQDVFDTSGPVTARDQVRRIWYYFQVVGGPFELYEGEDEYTASTGDDVDRENGTFPVVQISQFRPPSMGGHSRMEYMIEMAIGTPRS